MRKRLVTLGLSGVTALFIAAAAFAQPTSPDLLVQDLRKGGFVIVVRHMNTDPDQADTDTLHLENCAAQRQLTAAGRAAATAFGQALKRLKVPIGQVYVSAYCRALETAKLAGFDKVQASLDVSEPQNVSVNEGRRRGEAMRKLASTKPTAGTNTLIVSHRPNVLDAFGKDFFDIGEGEAAIFAPLDGPPGYRAVVRVRAETWTQLADAAAHGSQRDGTVTPANATAALRPWRHSGDYVILAETDAVAPPATARLLVAVIADGVQIYACEAQGNGFAWAFKAPEATLFDENGRQMGKHFAGPSWQALDGSTVTGEVAGKADAPGGGAIPWLLLRAKSHSGAGQFAETGFEQRLDTKGGLAPAAGCDGAQQGKEARMRYSATYVFYAAAP